RHRRRHAVGLVCAAACHQCAASLDAARQPGRQELKMNTLNGTLAAPVTGAPAAGSPAAGSPAALTPGAGVAGARNRSAPATLEPPWVRCLLILAALLFLGLFLFVPLFAVFAEAFRKGWDAYVAAIVEPDALAAIRLTLLTAAIAVPL